MSVEQLSGNRSPERLSVKPCSAGPRLVVVISGEADWATADRLRTGIAEALAYGPRSMDLDLTDLTFCDLHGLRVLLAAVEAAEHDGVDVGLHGMSRRLTRLYDIYQEGCRAYGPQCRSVRPAHAPPRVVARSVPLA